MSFVEEDDLVEQGALPPDDFHDCIERIREIANYELEIPANLAQTLERESQGLLVEPGILEAAAAALGAGHLVLQGPPGTGKSSLAAALCRAFHCGVIPVTAHENWSTYDVVGRKSLHLDDQGREQVVPENGFFTEAVIRCAGAIVRHFDLPEEPQATWLLIDELNRAHIERAFGEVFTAIGTDELRPVTLSHQSENNRELVTPRRFRIIATLNSVDRQFVNSLGQGLKRRFSFITLDIPAPRKPHEPWGLAEADASLASQEFTIVIERALTRIAHRFDSLDLENLRRVLLTDGKHALERLFEMVERVRYATDDSGVPYLPVGTAQLIDTVELFLTRVLIGTLDVGDFPQTMDWAASVKIAPLFDADTISPTDLETFANQLASPFDQSLRRELRQIAAAGLHYVG